MKEIITTCLLIIASITSARLSKGCQNPVKNFPGYNCIPGKNGILNESDTSLVYVVEKDSQKAVLKVQKIVESDMEDKLFEIIKTFDHPNIIKIFEIKKSGDFAYILMEYAEKGNLEDFMDKERDFDAKRKDKLEMFSKVVSSIQYLHQKGYVHADLGPDSIVLTSELEPKLISFNHLVEINSVQTGRHDLYSLPPEVVLNFTPTKEYTWGPEIDVYGLGLILYFMFNKRTKPFDIRLDPEDVMLTIEIGKYYVFQGVDFDIINIVHGCLATRELGRISLEDLSKRIEYAKDNQNVVLTEDEFFLSNREPFEIKYKTDKMTFGDFFRIYGKSLILFSFVALVGLIVLGFIGFKYFKKQKQTSENGTELYP